MGVQVGLLRIFALLLLVGVPLILIEKKGFFSSLWHALTLRYVSMQGGKRLTIFFTATSIVLFLFICQMSLVSFTKDFLVLDKTFMGLEKLWSYRIEGLPGTLIMFISDVINFICFIIAVLFLSVFSSCLYVSASKKSSERK